jgi:hypothetical protein
MELKAGYTQKELNAFFKASFRDKKTPRRTKDGRWTTDGNGRDVGAEDFPPLRPPEKEKKGFFKRLFGK